LQAILVAKNEKANAILDALCCRLKMIWKWTLSAISWQAVEPFDSK